MDDPFSTPPVSVAPMMQWTDRHCRYFLRCISRRVLLYTEMVTTAAILRGNRERLLAFDPAEHPVALQLGGSDPAELARCAQIGAAHGYDEINLNVGCPSERVRSGRFGACLMAEPDLVARCIEAMAAAVSVPVTVKSRIAIDALPEWPTLRRFAESVAAAGCRRLVIHARKAWLDGLSARENREIPPLRYDLVYRLKETFPALEIVLNGGVGTLEEVARHLGRVDGVMLGRAAYRSPYLLAEVDRRFFAETGPPPTRSEVVRRMLPYIERERASGTPLHAITRHMLGLFQGVPGARIWRRRLSERAPAPNAGIEVVEDALCRIESVAAACRTKDDGRSPALSGAGMCTQGTAPINEIG